VSKKFSAFEAENHPRWSTCDEVYRQMTHQRLFSSSCDLTFAELVDLAVKRGLVNFDVASTVISPRSR
jgi:hypothetical protein